MYDVIVVGARCAGSSTAMLLARKGYRVLLVDKARFPKDTVSTLFIHQPGGARLKRWGILERVVSAGTPAIPAMRWDFGSFSMQGAAPPVEGVSDYYAPRRTVLDTLLAEAAVEAGAELRPGFAVKELLFDDGSVVGVRGREGGGPEVEERGRMVVGADGVRSTVARSVEATRYNERPPRTSSYYSFWSDVPAEVTEILIQDRFAVLVQPTTGGLTMVAVQHATEAFPDMRRDVEGWFGRLVGGVQEVADRLPGGKREERFYGMIDIPNFFRKSSGPGWALVGDAGYHKDPVTAQGITDALRDAEALAEAIDDGFSGRRRLGDALAAYERDRDAKVAPFYEWTYNIAGLQPLDPRAARLLEAVSQDPEQVSAFLGIGSEVVRPDEFFSAENIARLLAGVSADRAKPDGPLPS